jgi:hypothetical protein
MPTNFDKFEELGAKVAQLRATLPNNPNLMSEPQLKELWDLIDEQHSYIQLIADKSRRD